MEMRFSAAEHWTQVMPNEYYYLDRLEKPVDWRVRKRESRRCKAAVAASEDKHSRSAGGGNAPSRFDRFGLICLRR
jgi:hypothetical protein